MPQPAAVLDRPTLPPLLTPAGDPTPAERATFEGILANHGPETFLWLVFHQPDGAARIHYLWTGGGMPLGDRIDDAAMAGGLDAVDWLEIGDRNSRRTHRGRIVIDAYALRPLHADVLAGVRATEERRAGIRRLLDTAVRITGQTGTPHLPRWLGVGPALLHRSNL